MFKKIILFIMPGIVLTCLYTYKLLDVPTGMLVDEGPFGYTAFLIGQNGRDAFGRFLPFFIQNSVGTDWHQPITQYFLVFLFKIFGPSLFLLRFSSVLVAIISAYGVYFLARKVLDHSSALFTALTFALAPLILIQSHQAQENIMPIPFVITWLYFLHLFSEQKKNSWLVISALALGLSFYSYKGMRALTPVFTLLTFIFLILSSYKHKIKFSSIGFFLFVIAPFYLTIPLWEKLYPGAILGGSSPNISNLYDFLKPYLASFDPSFIFIQGDILDFHSTGRHGMLLLASLPFILIGIYATINSKNYFLKFILIVLFTAPLLFGLVGSVHRFSRLLSLIPLYAIIAGAGFQWLKKNGHKNLLVVGTLFIFFNFVDFAYYYWFKYPPTTYNLVGELDYYLDVKEQAHVAQEKSLKAFVHRQPIAERGDALRFFQAVYFDKVLDILPDDESAPPGSILMTQRAEVPGMERVGEYHGYYLQINE